MRRGERPIFATASRWKSLPSKTLFTASGNWFCRERFQRAQRAMRCHSRGRLYGAKGAV